MLIYYKILTRYAYEMILNTVVEKKCHIGTSKLVLTIAVHLCVTIVGYGLNLV